MEIGGFMSEIQFIANTDEWKTIKKLKIEDKVPNIDILDFLASVNITLIINFEKILAKIIDITKLNEIVDNTKTIEDAKSRATIKQLYELIPAEYEKEELKKMQIYVKYIYHLKVLKKLKYTTDLFDVPIKINKKRKK